MAKNNKIMNKKKQTKKSTKKTDCKCKMPMFFVGGRVNKTKRKRKGKGKVASCTFFGGDNGDNNNAPYPINTKINAIEFPISTLPPMSGGKSNRNKNGTTRKRVKKMKGGSSILETGNPETKIMPTVLNGSNASAAISGVLIGNNSNVLRIPENLNVVNV